MTGAAPLLGTLVAPLPSRVALASRIAAVLLGTALLALSAKVQVPFWPVPMTMQTLVVLLIGAAYGSRLGAATVLLYLVEGGAGLPVFAGASAGPAYILGPTGGYLVGFVGAAWVTGALAERGWDRSPLLVIVAMTLGHVVLFSTGVAWLAFLIGADAAIANGFLPFVGATVLKTLLAAALIRAAWRGRAALG
ncbi:MAG: biotin transporter BioY [Rhodospirillales bacterium]|nr:biotin transporter BioY [Rhodospirillales bacterium]